jgi:hypothetical protein
LPKSRVNSALTLAASERRACGIAGGAGGRAQNAHAACGVRVRRATAAGHETGLVLGTFVSPGPRQHPHLKNQAFFPGKNKEDERKRRKRSAFQKITVLQEQRRRQDTDKKKEDHKGKEEN